MPAMTGTFWRQASVAFSPLAMSVQNRSNASLRRSAKSRRSSPRYMAICRPARASPLWRLARRPSLRRQLKAAEIKAWRDGTAAKRPVAEALRRLPGMSRHDRLRLVASRDIRGERQALDASRSGGDFERKRRAGVPVPDLDGIDAVPVRAFAAGEQKIDCG